MTRLLLLLGAQLAGLVLTHNLSAPFRAEVDPAWLESASLAVLLTAATHLGAWVLCWWLLLGTIHDLLATLADDRRQARAAQVDQRPRRRVAPVWVQRVVNRAVGAALVVGSVAAPAGAAGHDGTVVAAHQVVAPPVPIVGSDLTPPPTLPSPSSPSSTVSPPSVSPPSVSQPSVALPSVAQPSVALPSVPFPSDVPVADTATDTPGTPEALVEPMPSSDAAEDPVVDAATHTVAAGENLWVIARGTLSVDEEALPTDREVHAYWVRLIAGNAVASGDPDLILPGEVLRLPALDLMTTP